MSKEDFITDCLRTKECCESTILQLRFMDEKWSEEPDWVVGLTDEETAEINSYRDEMEVVLMQLGKLC